MFNLKMKNDYLSLHFTGYWEMLEDGRVNVVGERNIICSDYQHWGALKVEIRKQTYCIPNLNGHKTINYYKNGIITISEIYKNGILELSYEYDDDTGKLIKQTKLQGNVKICVDF
jgi:antitoxin component YwqK of YwqJK toxin-antitoxin module